MPVMNGSTWSNDGGHFSVRGDIVDVFAVNEPQPLRLAFFGDELESIRSFDVDTQKSLNDADRARILPVSLNDGRR